MKIIHTNQGVEFFVSDEDYLPLMLCRWTINQRDGYVRESTAIYDQQYLTVILARRMGFDPRGLIDHADRNKLNNQRENLRICTKSQNEGNSVGKVKGKMKGAFYDKSRNKFMALIMINYKSIFLGRFNTEEEAAKAYQAAALHYFGEFARTDG